MKNENFFWGRESGLQLIYPFSDNFSPISPKSTVFKDYLYQLVNIGKNRNDSLVIFQITMCALTSTLISYAVTSNLPFSIVIKSSRHMGAC